MMGVDAIAAVFSLFYSYCSLLLSEFQLYFSRASMGRAEYWKSSKWSTLFMTIIGGIITAIIGVPKIF